VAPVSLEAQHPPLPGQGVSANDLIRKQESKHGIDRTYQPVTEVRLLSGLHWVDVCRAEKINVRKPGRQQCPLGLSFVACEGKPASSCRVSTIPAQERKNGVRTPVTQNSRELNRVAGSYGAKCAHAAACRKRSSIFLSRFRATSSASRFP
jgi:hypothetical protein